MARFNFILLFFFSVVCRAQSYPESNINYLVKTGIWHLVVNNYSEAERQFDLLNRYFPDNPLSQLTRGMLLMAEASDIGKALDFDSLVPLLNKAESNSELLLQKNQNAWNYFLAGASFGFSTFHNYLAKNYFSLLFDGLSAISKFEKCIAYDPNFYAAHIGIGTYKYWRSDALKSLDWLPFLDDESEEGVQQLKFGLKEYSLLQSFGMESLIWIYLHEKNYNAAYTLAKKQLEIYPNSRFFLWAYAHAAKYFDKKEAIEVFNLMLNLLREDNISNRIKEIQILHKTAVLYEETGDYEMALANCEAVLKIKNLNDYERGQLGDRLAKVEQLRKRLVKRLNR